MRRYMCLLGLVCVAGAFSCAEDSTGRSARGRRDREGAGQLADAREREIEGEKEGPPDDPGEAAAFHVRKRLGVGGAPIPHNALLRAKAQADVLRTKRTVGDDGIVSWSWMGPGNIGGRIRAIYVHPTNGFMMVGSTGGGIWTSWDSGGTWTPSSDFIASLAVTAFAVELSNPSSPVFYASTGEGFGGEDPGTWNSNKVRGAGVFVSTDWGAHWSQLPATNSPDWYWVNDLAVNPQFPPGPGSVPRFAPRPDGVFSPVLVAATLDGLRVSATGGATWSTRLAGVSMADVDYSPNVPSKAVAGSMDGRAYFSNDMGLSWSPARWLDKNGNPMAPANDSRVELTYDPSVPNRVYASVEYQNLPTKAGCEGRIFRSQDGGVTYKLLWSDHLVFSYPGADAGLKAFGAYHNTLWVAPDDKSCLLLGGINLWRSTDFGNSFQELTAWDGVGRTYLHADQQAFVTADHYGPGNRAVYIGNDGGLNLLPDISAATIAPLPRNNGLGITQFYGGTIDGAGRVAGGAQDNGSSFAASEDPNAWQWLAPNTDGGFIASHPLIPDSFFTTSQNLFISRYDKPSSGTQWTRVGLFDARLRPCNFIAPILLDPVDAHCLYAGGVDLWRLDDPRSATDGSSWISVPGSSIGGTPISAIAVSPVNSDEIWLGYNNGTLRRSTDGGNTWKTCGGSTLPGRWVSDIEVVSATTAYVTFMGFEPDNVWGTTDGGIDEEGGTWNDLRGTGGALLPEVPVSTIAAGACQRLFIGTDVGVFQSSDGGAHWTSTASGPVNVQVDQLFWEGSDRSRLYAATYGRGMWQAEVLACCGKAQVLHLNGAFPSYRTTRHSGARALVCGGGSFNSNSYDRVEAFERHPEGWVSAGELPETASLYGAWFDIKGDHAVVGRQLVNSDRTRVTAYRWNSEAHAWSIDQEFEAPGTEQWRTDSGFGFGVRMSGNRVLVGAPYYNQPWDFSTWSQVGAAIIYKLEDGGWVEEDRITGEDVGLALPWFGYLNILPMALDGERAAIGAFDWDSTHYYVLVFEFDSVSSSWELAQSIPVTYTGPIALEGGTLAVVTHDRVEMYARNPDTGLFESNGSLDALGATDVSVEGDTMAIGCWYDQKVRIAERVEGTWKPTRVYPGIVPMYAGCCESVSLDGGSLFIGVAGLDGGKGGAQYVPCVK